MLTQRMQARHAVPAVLVAGGAVIIVISVGVEALPLAGGWILAAALAGWLWFRARATLRLGIALALVPVCILLTWEGGLFFLPAALALIAISLAPKLRQVPLVAIALAAAIVAGLGVVVVSSDDGPDSEGGAERSLSRAEIKESYSGTKAEWLAIVSPLRDSQIAMVCDVSGARAVAIQAQLQAPITRQTLAYLNKVCA